VELLKGIVEVVFFLVGLSLVVAVHEFGHFVAARWAGVEVEAFAIGWGKVLWARRFGKTEFRLCLLPLGGYCKMKGEQDLIASMGRGDAVVEASPGSLFAAKPWKKILISAAGPVFNLLFALVIFGVMAWVGSPTLDDKPRIELGSQVDGRPAGPAEAAGLRTGDLVLSIDGKAVETFTELHQITAASDGRPVTWRVDRDGQVLELTVTPQLDPKEKQRMVGVYVFVDPVVGTVDRGSKADIAGFAKGDRVVAADGTPVTGEQLLQRLQTAEKDVTVTVIRNGQSTDVLVAPDRSYKNAPPLGLHYEQTLFPGKPTDPVTGAVLGWDRTWWTFGMMLDGLGKLLTGKINPLEALSGPIGMEKMSTAATTAAFAKSPAAGWAAIFNIVAIINLALFMMNLLPIPALDGGSIVVSLVEAARRHPLELRYLIRYQQVGVFVVLGLILFTTLNDLGVFGKK
jgi:regulator of sigma E protease